MLAADTGGETTKVRVAAGRDKLSVTVIVAVPACGAVKTADAFALATVMIWLVAPFANVPRVVAKVTVDAPGADTVMVCGLFVTNTALLAGEVTANIDAALPLV